ncbi:hypothetical protein ABPG72_022078 [Tetrahymena utriculariae]
MDSQFNKQGNIGSSKQIIQSNLNITGSANINNLFKTPGVGDENMQGMNFQKENGDAFITDPAMMEKNQYKDLARLGFQKKKGHIYKIEEAELPTNFNSMYTPLPVQVEFKRIISNIMNARHIKKQEEWGKDGITDQNNINYQQAQQFNNNQTYQMNSDGTFKKVKRRETEYDKWLRYLSLEENVAIVSDSFWYAISKFQEKRLSKLLTPDEFKVEEKKFKQIQERLLNRIARNYVNILLSIENKNDNNTFFKKYFDIIAQAVFYSFFYAFPKSRSEFGNELKSDLINEFSYLFTGIQITNSQKYWSQWNLDLGAGNILAEDKKAKQSITSHHHAQHTHQATNTGGTHGVTQSVMQTGSNTASKPNSFKDSKSDSLALPSIGKELSNTRNKRVLMPIKFSPILDKYIHSYNYQTKNYVTGFKMKFTQYDANKEVVEQKFKSYLDLAEKIKERSDEMIIQNNISTKKMKDEIKKLKNETIKHHRRLEKRKQEELERGAHEYANYLVSMLDAGLARGNIGVINQNPLS